MSEGPWRKRVEIGDAVLYLGDCLEVMPALGGVDHIITDPPYEAEAHAPHRRVMGSGRLKRAPLSFAPVKQREQAAAEMCAISGGWVLAFCQAEAVYQWREAFLAGGGRWRLAAIWVKPDASPRFSGDAPAKSYEAIACAWAGGGQSRWNGGGRRGVFIHPKAELRHGHETQKPQALMCELVDLFTNRGETVCDPYAGSGSTGVACANLGRKFIGIEIEERYFDIACERIDAAYAQGRLFV